MLVDLLLPRTDAGAIGQAVAVLPALAVATILVRRDREWRTFALGLLVFSTGFLGLRMLH